MSDEMFILVLVLVAILSIFAFLGFAADWLNGNPNSKITHFFAAISRAIGM